MKAEFTAVQERWNEYDGKKGHVKERILVLLDTIPCEENEVSQTMTYVMTPEETLLVPPNGLRMKPVAIAVKELREWGGGIRFGGRLTQDTLAPFRKPAATAK